MDPKDKLIEYQNYRIDVLQDRIEKQKLIIKKLEIKLKNYEKRETDRVI
tara:strand:- start:225 stop:371 length:147 start_codon:yes stop_codon:yes gene_type:complete